MSEWFTCAELADLCLNGLPRTKRRVNSLASRGEWRRKKLVSGNPASRKRPGRGGGYEYHYTILPHVTIEDLVGRGLVAPKAAKPKAKKASNWKQFEASTDDVKMRAKVRLRVLTEIENLQRSGFTKEAAIQLVRSNHQAKYKAGKGDQHNFSRATIFNWYKTVEGLAKEDWLPALTPLYSGGRKKTQIDRRIIDYLRTDYLRAERPSFASCWERLVPVAEAREWALPLPRTVERRFLDGVPFAVQVLLREGPERADQLFPAQIRDRTEYHAMEAINADGHIWDVFVHDRAGEKPYRPVMCAIQDLYSNKIVGWRIGRTLGSDLVRLSFGDMFRNYGIPKHCWLDNGREFASKMVTGGAPNRFRFKVKEEEPEGFLTSLGVDVKWTRPYRGQSKPIERAFRDFCDHIAKHPKFAGAYTGNMVTNKPHNYGSKSVHIDVFKKVVNAGIEAHNAKMGRRTPVCRGKASFNEAFNESYAVSPIRRATEEQLRYCLLAAENRRSCRKSGSVTILDNTYWNEAMSPHAGEKFTVRFDPDNLHGSAFIYLNNGSFLCEAECWHAQGFSDQKSAREHSNAKKKFIKAQKDLAAAEVPLNISEIADMLPEIESEDFPDNKVVEPVFEIRGNMALAPEPEPEMELDMDVLRKNVEIFEFNKSQEAE